MWWKRRRPRPAPVSLDKGLLEAKREACLSQERRQAQEAKWPEVNQEVGLLQRHREENHFAARFRQALGGQ